MVRYLAQRVTPLSINETGLGYQYFRCRSRGDDSTVYLHQLAACLAYDPHDVFDPSTDLHHVLCIPELNVVVLARVPELKGEILLRTVDACHHRSANISQ